MGAGDRVRGVRSMIERVRDEREVDEADVECDWRVDGLNASYEKC